ncbi:MAG: hypothetical protein ACRD12_10775 [Acidimicrobiales bacterium]
MTAVAIVSLVAVTTALVAAIQKLGWRAVASPPPAAAPARRAETPPPIRRTPPVPVVRLVALLGAVLVPIAMLAWVNSTTGFVWDDIKNLRQAQLSDLSIDYLMEPTSGHWAPGHRLADWALQRYFPFNVAASQMIVLVGFAVVLLLFHRMLAELMRPGKGPLLMTVLFGASVTNVGVTQWWASATDRVPATIGSFIAIFAYLKFYKTRDRRWLVLSVLGLGFSFCFYIKPVFVPVYLVLIRVLLLDPERPLRETVVAAAREWRIWLVYAAATGLFLLVYIRTYPTGLSTSPDASMLTEYLSLLWFKVVVPNLFGFYLSIDTTSALAAAGIVLAQLFLVAVVFASIVRWRPAWRAWALFAAGYAMNAVIIAETRLGPFPVKNIAWTISYNLEISWLFFLAAGFAFFGRRATRPVAATATATASTPAAGPRWSLANVAIAAGLVTYLAFSLEGGFTYSEPKYWIGAQSRLYLDNVAAGLEAVRAGGDEVVLVDGVVPENVVPYFLVTYNSDSEVLPLLSEDVDFNAIGRPRMYDFDPEGRIRAVTFIPLAGGLAAPMLFSGELGVIGATIEPGREAGGFCVAPQEENASILFVPSQPLVSGDGLYLDMKFTSSGAGRMSFPVVHLESEEPIKPHFRVVNIQRSDQETVYELDFRTAKQVGVVVTPGIRFCLDHLYVGRVLAD